MKWKNNDMRERKWREGKYGWKISGKIILRKMYTKGH